MVFSCERVCGRARTMLRRVVEARTKKSGRFSFSDSALRHSRRRWSRACCSGVKVSVGSGVVVRGRVKVSAVSCAVGAVEEECGGLSATAAECAAFGRNDGVCGVGERNGNSNNKGKGVLGWLIVCDPTHRKGAMDGAPGRRFIGMIKATAPADFLRYGGRMRRPFDCAQGRNDGVWGSSVGGLWWLCRNR